MGAPRVLVVDGNLAATREKQIAAASGARNRHVIGAGAQFIEQFSDHSGRVLYLLRRKRAGDRSGASTIWPLKRKTFRGCKSMLETRGLWWAWFIHFWQDVLIFSFLAIGSIMPGG